MSPDPLPFEPVATLTIVLERTEQTADDGTTHEHHRAILKREGEKDAIRSGPTAREAISELATLLLTG